jgi:UDP-glucose 4-epimerase
MNCLILGGAGFIGSHLVDALIERGHQITVFDRPNIDLGNLVQHINRIRIFCGDFNNAKEVVATLQGIDVVFNLDVPEIGLDTKRAARELR